MTQDDYLEKLLDSIKINDYKNIEKYAKVILKNIEEVKVEFRHDIKKHMESLINQSQKEFKKEKLKNDLIDEIMKPK